MAKLLHFEVIQNGFVISVVFFQDAETIERLNEMGELRTILKPYKSVDACSTCKVCGGYRLLPCSVCKGSKKSIHRNNFTAEFVSLKYYMYNFWGQQQSGIEDQ
ncbi:hypothetical protein RUM43_006650 [Polyplax serrata]|uniref:Uncharacterized protein n=1 Tax=Polyplax serrata TaxID=468196 RepID=A0AAN8PF88_POLSC